MELTIGGLVMALFLGFICWRATRAVKSPLSNINWF